MNDCIPTDWSVVSHIMIDDQYKIDFSCVIWDALEHLKYLCGFDRCVTQPSEGICLFRTAVGEQVRNPSDRYGKDLQATVTHGFLIDSVVYFNMQPLLNRVWNLKMSTLSSLIVFLFGYSKAQCPLDQLFNVITLNSSRLEWTPLQVLRAAPPGLTFTSVTGLQGCSLAEQVLCYLSCFNCCKSIHMKV